jgi:protein-tyrosine phosphatase
MASSPELVTVDNAPPSAELRGRIAALLEQGSLVALPTETVYGIAARVDSKGGWAALTEAKGRSAEQGATWHVGSSDALDLFPEVSPLARRLAARYWPGPLTLILPGVPEGLEAVARDGWTGVRQPAHAFTADVLRDLGFPVVLSSANRHGEEPLSSAEAIQGAFAGSVELVVDGGRPSLGEASTLLKVGPGHFELLRPGLFSLAELRAAAGRKIAFVCTGNTCRSPMAEGLARHQLAERLGVAQAPDAAPLTIEDFGFHVSSMGVFASSGAPPSLHAVDVLKERGIDISGHGSSPVIAARIEEQDEVYALTSSHLDALLMSLPPGKGEHVQLLDPEGGDIPDPIGGSLEQYERCAQRIAECVERRLESWA